MYQDWTFQQASYIHDRTEVGSPLWNESSTVMAGYQRLYEVDRKYREKHPSELDKFLEVKSKLKKGK